MASTPTGVTAQAIVAGVKLSWTLVAGAASYAVKRSTTAGGPYATVASGVNGSTYSETGLNAKDPYFYVITASDAAGESAPSAEVSANPAPSPPWWRDIRVDAGTLIGASLMGLAIWLLVRNFGAINILENIKDQAYARGVITFIVTFGTIVLAFVLIGSALFSDNSSDERFRRGREVFSVLAGVLGTIVGFYFGSADKETRPVAISDIRATATGVSAYAYGGVAPYRYSIEVNGTSVILNHESVDGWIVGDLAATGVKEKDLLKISVIDKNNQEESVTREVTKDDLTVPASP